MRKMIILILCTAAALTVGGLILPAQFTIERSTTINTHPVRVLRLVSSLDRWPDWWPWNRGRPGDGLRLGEQTSNPGASVSWTRPAAGRAVLTAASIYKIDYDIFFERNTRPDKGAFMLRGSAEQTELTWSVKAHYEIPVLGGYLALLADSMHGGMLSWGLNKIKALAEQDTTELNLYYQDEQGREVEERVK